MFTEHKKRNDTESKSLIFDELETKTGNLKVGGEKNLEKGKKYGASDVPEQKKKKSIKKAEQKASSVSLNISKKDTDAPTSHRSNSMESNAREGIISGNMGLGIMEAASMMCNIVDITTDSTSKSAKDQKSNQARSKGSRGSINAGPFAQMKEAQEQKKKNKQSFDNDDADR